LRDTLQRMDSAQLFLSLFMSVVGAAYMLYGKKKPSIPFFVAGLILSFAGYFVESFWWTLAGFAGLCAAPFFVR
jgi:hypothetical protein